MPIVALSASAVTLALTFGLRSWLQWRRTGRTGFQGVSGAPGSLEWLGGMLFVVALVAGALAPALELAGAVARWHALDTPGWHAAGVVLWAFGTAGTLWAQLAMGDSWRIGVDREERTALVTGGPFRWVRNPIFTAMTLATAGLALLVPNVVSGAAIAALVTALEIHVRVAEEPFLVRTHGEPYLRWAAHTGRFVPGIGRLAVPPAARPGDSTRAGIGDERSAAWRSDAGTPSARR